MTDDTAELWIRDTLVVVVTDVTFADGTYFGSPRFALDDEDELHRRLMQFVNFSVDWNRRVREGSDADAGEFDAFADLMNGDWTCRRRDVVTPIADAPSFFDPSECSWVCTRPTSSNAMNATTDEYVAKTLKACATFLARWKGATAALWELTSSHRTLRIVLTKAGHEGNLLFACGDPYRLSAPVRWDDSDFVVARALMSDGTDGFSLRDEKAGVEVLCGALEVKENVKLW